MEKGITEQSQLTSRAQSILGGNISKELTQWYKRIVDSTYRYKVFISQRSYNLALLLEKITDLKMQDTSYTKYLTDSAMFMYCTTLAEGYKSTQSFPSILLCTDIVSTGKDINHYLECLEEELIRLLPNEDPKEVRYALVNAINIQMYVRSDKQLLLLPRFELGFECKRKVDAKEQHQLECNIQYLLQTSHINTQPWIYSCNITKNKFNDLINTNEFIHTKYQNMHEYAKTEIIKYNNTIQSMLTLRITEERNTDTYKAIPLVLLPNLGADETTNLLKKLVNKLELNEEEKKYIQKLINTPGKRLLNELITLILSCSLLHENNITLDNQQKEEELNRLVRNYNLIGFEKTKEFLSKIVDNKTLSIGEIKDILSSSITQHSICLIGYDSISDETRIKNRLNNYFYSSIADEEKETYSLRQQQLKMLVQSSDRRIRGCGFIIKELVEGYDENTIKNTIAYLLQLLDAGIISISSYASNRVNVVGFTQCLKVEEQALFIYPLQNYLYMPLLSRIENRLFYTSNDIVYAFKKYISTERTDLIEQEAENIVKFLTIIKSLGQNINDWNGNYMFIVQTNDDLINDNWRSDVQYVNKQYEYLEVYNKYIRETGE